MQNQRAAGVYLQGAGGGLGEADGARPRLDQAGVDDGGADGQRAAVGKQRATVLESAGTGVECKGAAGRLDRACGLVDQTHGALANVAQAADRVVHVVQHVEGAAALDLGDVVGAPAACILKRHRAAALQGRGARHAKRGRTVAGCAGQRYRA